MALPDLARRVRLPSWLANLSLRWKIGILAVAGLAAIFTLFGILGLAIVQEDAQRLMSERLAVARTSAAFLDSELLKQFADLDGVASELGSNPLLVFDVAALTREPEGVVVSAFVLDPQSGVRWVGPSDVSLLEQPDVVAGTRALMNGPRRYISGAYGWQGGHSPIVVMAVPVLDPKGVRTGVLGLVIDVSGGLFSSITEGAKGFARTGHAELVDQNGRVVASSEQRRVLAAAEHPDFYLPLLTGHGSGAAVTAPVAVSRDHVEERHAMAFAPLEIAPWGLSVGGTEAELAAQADHWRNQVLLFGGLSLLVCLFVVGVTTRNIARPVLALTVASRRIADGDLLTPVPHSGQGEILVLAESLDDMRGHLEQALEAVAVEKSRYEGIVGSMADAVITTDLEGRITAFNPAAATLTGCSAEQAIGCLYGDLLPELQFAGGLPGCHQVGVAKQVVTRGDRHIVVATIRSPVCDQQGNVAGFVSVLRDVSAEEEVSRLKDEFLSTISHELRTPLGYVKGYASTLLLPDGLDDSEVARRCLGVIVESSDELTELVDNLLDMSKIGAGVLSVSPSPLRLRPLVRAAVERARGRADGHRLVVRVPSSLPRAQADAHRVEQVLFNLLDNAIKYSPEGGSIVVAATERDGELIVSVSDDGPGIPGDELETIFVRFQRGGGARRQRISGSGLGLAICKGIVEAHGGRIWAESPAHGGQAGARPGTTIWFSLPVAADRPARKAGTQRSLRSAA